MEQNVTVYWHLTDVPNEKKAEVEKGKGETEYKKLLDTGFAVGKMHRIAPSDELFFGELVSKRQEGAICIMQRSKDGVLIIPVSMEQPVVYVGRRMEKANRIENFILRRLALRL